MQPEHYIISSGLKEIIEGTPIAEEFKEIYAASFCYDEHGVACWPAMAVNYTSKTQFLFRVNKGVLDVTEHRALNEFMPEEKRRVPFSNMIYIGDGLTDVPSMKLTKLNGGHSIAVWQEDEQISNEMLLEGRVDFAVKADYSRGSDMEKMVFAIIDQIAASAKTAQMHVAACDRAKNAVTYRVYGCEDAQEARYEAALDGYEQAAVRANVWQAALPPLYLAASGAGVLFILWFGAKNVLGTGWSAWDIGVFTTFLSCFTRLTVKSSKAAKLFNSVQKAEVSWKRIKPLMKSPEALDDLRIPQSADVTLDNLSFTYGDAPIFSGLSLTAHPGDIIGVTGPVACGKSTFGRVFLCEMPYGGSVRFGGKELSSFSPREISGMVGYLGHDPELSLDTIQNNVLFGSRQDVLPQLNAVVLTDEVLAMENGADTVVGSSGARLSGGQAQRLALARTLAHPRPLMILDDPFSALDRKTEDAVFANLQAYAKDKVVFLISHRLYHFPQMQQVIFMEDGKTTVGTHDELMASVPTYRWLYESQTGG